MKHANLILKTVLFSIAFFLLALTPLWAQTEKESNNDFASANLVPFTGEASGSVCLGDVDYFKIVLPRDGVFRVNMKVTNTGAGYATLHVSGYDQRQASGNLFNSTPAYSTNSNAELEANTDVFCRSAGDTIYLAVQPESQCFSYKLSFSMLGEATGSDAVDNNDFLQGIAFNIGDTVRGHIGYWSGAGTKDAVDYFKTVLPQDGRYRIIMEATNTGNGYGSMYVSGYDQRKENGNLLNATPAYSTYIGATTFDSVDLFCRSADDTLYFKVTQNSQCFNYKITYKLVSEPTENDTEPNNTYQQATLFNIGDTARGHIGYVAGGGVTDATDVYKTVLPQDGKYRIIMEATNTGNGYGSLYVTGYDQRKENGNLFNATPAYSIYSESRTVDSLDLFCRSAGDTLYFIVTQNSQCFNYKITYRLIGTPTDNDVEPNNSFQEAIYLAENDTARGHIGYVAGGGVTDQVDFYRFVVPKNGVVKVYMEGTNTGNGYGSLYVSGYDQRKENGNVYNATPAYSIYSNQTTNEIATLYGRSAGDSIYLKVTQNSQCFNYKLSYKVIPPDVENDPEPNNNFAEAGTFNAGDSVQGHIGYVSGGTADANDFYKSLLPAEGIIKVKVRSTNTGNGYGSLYMTLYDSKTNEFFSRSVAYSVYTGATTVDEFTIPCRLIDTTYFRLSYSGQPFTYTVSYEVLSSFNGISDPEPNNSFATAAFINAGDTVKGNIGHGGAGNFDGVDYFKIKVPKKGAITVHVEATNTGNAYGYLYIRGFDQAQNQLFDRAPAYSTSAGTVSIDNFNLYCQSGDTLYFRIQQSSQCYSYKLVYNVTLGADTTVHACSGCTTDISKLYNVAPFSSVKYEDMAALGTPVDPTSVKAGAYLLTVINGTDECTRDTAIISVTTGQVIQFDSIPDKMYGNAPFAVKATSSEGLPVTYKVLTGPVTMEGDLVTITGVGEVTIRAEQAGNSGVNYAFADRTFRVNKATASITLSDKENVYDGKPGAPKVTTDPASLPVTFTYNGSSTAAVNAGRYDVVAMIDHELYTGSVTDTFLIKKAEQTVSLTPVPDKDFTINPFAVSATASSGLPVSFTLQTTPEGIASVSGNTITLSGLGTVIIHAVQNGNENYHPSPLVADTFLVKKGGQTISFASLANQMIGDTVVLNATASSSLPVMYSIATTPASGVAILKGDTILLNGTTGRVTVTATQEGNKFYNRVEEQRSFDVLGRPQTITFDTIPNKVFGDAPFTVTATASSSLLVSFRIVSGPATIDKNVVTLTGDGTVIVEAMQGGSSTFQAAPAIQRSFVVKRKYVDLLVQNVTSTATTIGPNDAATITWTVSNVGELSSATDWTERIYIQSATGENRTLIKQVAYATNNTLDSGITVARTESIILPAQVNIGDNGVFVVEVVPGSTVKEAPVSQTNNTAVQQASWTVKKLLRLDLSAAQLTEGVSAGITATLTRTGSVAGALTVSLGAKAPARFTMPATVTIPAGQAAQSITILAANNNFIEGTVNDTLAMSATGFAGAKQPVAILDDDKPTLTFTSLPTEAMEGQSVTFSVNTDLVLTQPLQVLLTSNNNARFAVPASVTIPAGATSTSITITLAQDQIPEIDVLVNLIAGAANHHAANATIQVKDDDIPGLELVIATNTVPEAGGAYATRATLRRKANSNTAAFTANLTANLSNTLILPSTITLAAGENEKSFDIGVVDNSVVDGDRKVIITASIFVNSCGCSAPSTSSGTVSSAINVTDNDGPALIVSASQLTLAEGLANAGTLRITRNTGTTASLVVNLSSSNTAEATVPVTVTIPAGQSFAEVPITTINDNESDGNKQVYFGATAASYSPGSVWVVVSDQNKPDLLVPVVRLKNNSVQAMAIFNYTLTVKNTGFATAPPGVLIRGYLSKDNLIDPSDSLISADVMKDEIPAGESRLLVNAIRMPDLPGTYKVLYQVNPEATLTELLLTNNISTAVDLSILPDYTATAAVDNAWYLKGITIPVTGKAVRSNGTAAANAAVEVYVLVNGFRRTVNATTGSDGRYTAQFVPLQNEAGHYTVGASYPGLGATTEQDNFDILGVKVNNGEVPQFKVTRNDTLKGSLPVLNMSSTPLTNFSLLPVTLPSGATIRFDTVAVLGGNQSVNLTYTVSGSTLSPGNNYQVAGLKAAATEGSIQPFTVYYYCQAPNAYLEASINDISVTTTASAGEKLVQFRLTNKGIGASGEVTLNLPQVSWLKTVTPVKMPSLAPGDTAVVVLKFLALEEVPFGYPAKGSIGVTSQNGNAFTIPFTFEKVAQSTGTVKITVTDQFTYYSASAPKVKGAHVVIKNYYTGEVYADGYSDDNGVFTANGVPEGTQRVVVEKDQHHPYSGNLVINPGRTLETTVFLNYQAITFNWSVVPTAVQDEFDITLETKFETNVPMPVVTIDMPKTMPQLSGSETYAFNVTLTNHGLITANEVKLGLPTDDPEYEFITNYVPSDLVAQQSIQVPVIMRRRGAGSGGRAGLNVSAVSQFLGMDASQYAGAARVADGSGGCQSFTSVSYWYKCNTSTGLWEKGGTLFSYSGRRCGGGPTPHYGGLPIDAGGIPTSDDGGYNDVPCATCGPGNGIVIPNPFPPAKEEKKSCKDCIDEIKGALGCGAPPTPGDVGKCVAGNVLKGAEWTDYIECIPIKLPPHVACLLAVNKVADKCSGIGSTGRIGGPTKTARMYGVSPLGEVFDRIAGNLKLVERSMLLSQAWGKEYYGDMVNSDALTRFTAAIQSSVNALDSIRTGKQDSVLAIMTGYEIQPDAIRAFFTRWNTSVYARSQGVLAPNETYPGIIDWTRAKSYADSIVLLHNDAVAKGYESVDDMYMQEFKSLNEFIEKEQNAVCASVTIQLSQRLTMTREAFEGTLEIFNGHPTDKMDSLTVNIKITDENGVPSNDLFQIDTKSLSSNLANVTGTGAIAAQQTGSVKFIFIPETGAAPTAPKLYNFSGSVTYWDPYVGEMVTMPLSSVPLTVNPSPSLMLHYFMQRNILGDDALTSPAIEPSEPAELGVMVENHGYGQAVNMMISSAQPKIVENEKGLAINFNLIGSAFQGQAKKMGVTDINFGTIPAQQTRVGQWYFTSSLLGKFVDYDAKVVHSNSFGNPELSLVKGVKLHELTKSIKLYGGLDDGITDFLVNDIFDLNDVPDAIYFSQGNRTAKVHEATTGSFDKLVGPPSFTNNVTVTPSQAGWNYIKLDDPGKRMYEIESVTRNDGQAIPLDNAWLTYVTLPASQAPKYENKFHLVDTFTTVNPVTYTVVWKAKSTDIPKVDTITGAPTEVSATQVSNLKVVFNKAIDVATFTHEDLSLTFQGGQNIMNNTVMITQEDTATFNVDLSSLTTGNGFYAFTVQAADVADVYGVEGETGKQVSWTQMLNVPVVEAFEGISDPHVAKAYEKIQVRFNLPIDVPTVTSARFRVLKDGVVQTGTLVVDSVRTDHKLYYLSGLGNILTQSGTYELEVDLPNIKSASGVFGIQKQSVLLTVDNTGPVVTLEKSGEGGLDALHKPYVAMKFNEDVSGFNTASLKLTRNGEELPVTFDMLSNTDLKTWKAGTFGMLTYPDGTYTFIIDMSTVKDAIGNFGTGTQSVTWVVDRSSLITITNLGFTPDRGYNDKDAVTSGQNLNVTFHLDKAASRVTVYQYDLSGQTVLATVDNVSAGDVSVPVSMATFGNTGIRVHATGVTGGEGRAERTVFIDPVPLTAGWSMTQNQQLVRQVDTVMLFFSDKLLSASGFMEALTLKHNGAPLSTAGLQYRAVNDTVYEISGIRSIGATPGNYELGVDLASFSKYLSGKEGAGAETITWTLLSTNQAPVANVVADTVATRIGAFTINGSRSFDPDADALTYQWVAPEGIVLTNDASATPSFDVSLADNGKTYTFLLVVKDGSLFTTASVNVNVQLSPGTNLPVTWLYFRGEQKQKDALLTWATTSEENAKAFVIERSLDGTSFNDVGTVAAKGSRLQISQYSFVDKDAMLLPAPVLYYRLRQIDLSGLYTYSTIVALPVNRDQPTSVSVQVYPNPFVQDLVLQLTNVPATGKDDHVSLHTADGRVVYQRKLSVSGNATIHLTGLPNLTPGIYLLRANINGKVYTVKLFRE